MSKVAWALIVGAGEDPKDLQRALASINGYVDGIFIQLNAPKGKKIPAELKAVAEGFADLVYEYRWKNNFVDARNDLFAKVPKEYDWIGWMDVDDVIAYPEKIQTVCKIMPKNVNCIHIMYDYQNDEFGNVVVQHWSARLVRNNGSYKWKSSFDDTETAVHETLQPVRSDAGVANDEFRVVHMADAGHHEASLERNIQLLESMFDRQNETEKGVDPRILYYLGSHYFEAGRLGDAMNTFIEYLKLSGWDEERSEAHVYMGRLLWFRNNVNQARTAFLMALGENPNNPGAYLELGKLEARAGRWEQAAEWLKRGLDIKTPITAMVQFKYDYELLAEYSQALLNIGGNRLEEALRVSKRALKLRPDDPDARDNQETIIKIIKHRDNLRGVGRLLSQLKEEKHEERILPLLDALPDSVQDSPLVIQARQDNMEPVKWPYKSIAIYCGFGPLGTWGPWSLNEGGTGGSEEAVVRLSQELARLGWRVVVYAMPGTRVGTYDDVEWKHYWEFNARDKFDILVVWRQPGMFDIKYKARKTYLWLHDVMPAEELTKERLKNVTKIIYVSKYHSTREESKHISARKKLASGNGIAPADFSALDKRSIKRIPQRCIYMSANERGLRILYDIWEDVRRVVPAATLDVYYGWHSFDAVNRDNPERMMWKAMMQDKARSLPGVTEHGRIGQDQLNEEIFGSGVFAYPCTFPEVNCITAQKAMAGGAWPVVSDFAVLPDIIEFGDIVSMNNFQKKDIENYKQALIERLKNPPSEQLREAMMKWARKEFAWRQTARQWDQEMV